MRPRSISLIVLIAATALIVAAADAACKGRACTPPSEAAAGAREWPLLHSLGQPLGRLISGGSDGTPYRVTSVRVRGCGCAASTVQQRSYTLVQVIARAPSGGTKAFLDTRALDGSSPSGQRALARLEA